MYFYVILTFCSIGSAACRYVKYYLLQLAAPIFVVWVLLIFCQTPFIYPAWSLQEQHAAFIEPMSPSPPLQQLRWWSLGKQMSAVLLDDEYLHVIYLWSLFMSVEDHQPGGWSAAIQYWLMATKTIQNGPINDGYNTLQYSYSKLSLNFIGIQFLWGKWRFA